MNPGQHEAEGTVVQGPTTDAKVLGMNPGQHEIGLHIFHRHTCNGAGVLVKDTKEAIIESSQQKFLKLVCVFDV